MQLESGQQGGVKEHQLIDAKHNFLNYTMKKPSLLKQSAEEGERTEKLKAGDEVIVNTYGQRGTLLKDNGKGQWQVQLGILK